MRFAYAGKAISGSTYGGVWHCQFLNCGTAIQIDDTDTDLHNVLFANCGTALAISYCGDVVRGEHVTADQITKLWQNSCGDSAKLTNSILTAIANLGTNVSLYNCTTNSSAAGIFQSVGAAGYYHIDGSTNRNAGLTNISPALAKDLKLITTYPPIILTNGITTDTTLSPQAQRDADIPDLGYHYSPLDYVVNGISLTNTLTLTNGVVLATYGASTSYGISVSGSGKLISQGQPNCLNYIVRYNTVQEQSNTNWSSSTIGPSVKIGSANA